MKITITPKGKGIYAIDVFRKREIIRRNLYFPNAIDYIKTTIFNVKGYYNIFLNSNNNSRKETRTLQNFLEDHIPGVIVNKRKQNI